MTRLTFSNIAQFVTDNNNCDQMSDVVIVGQRTFSWLKLNKQENGNKNGNKNDNKNCKNNVINRNNNKKKNMTNNNDNSVSYNDNVIKRKNNQIVQTTQNIKDMQNTHSIHTQTAIPLLQTINKTQMRQVSELDEQKMDLSDESPSQQFKFKENIDPNMTIANSVEALPFVNKPKNLDLITTPNKKQEEKLKINENYTNFRNHLIVFEFSQLRPFLSL